MKTISIFIISTLVLAVTAQPRKEQNIFQEFGVCQDGSCKLDSECCNFKDGLGNYGKFCMTT